MSNKTEFSNELAEWGDATAAIMRQVLVHSPQHSQHVVAHTLYVEVRVEESTAHDITYVRLVSAWAYSTRRPSTGLRLLAILWSNINCNC